MARPNQEYVELKCLDCSEFMHVRIVSDPRSRSGSILLRRTFEVFCPACGQTTNALNQFKKQYHAEKKSTQISN